MPAGPGLPDKHRVKVFTRNRKKKTMVVLVANEYPQRQGLLQAWSKNAQAFYRSRLLKRLPFSNISPKMKKQGLFLLGVRASSLRISPLLTLDSLEIGVQEIAERAIRIGRGGGVLPYMGYKGTCRKTCRVPLSKIRGSTPPPRGSWWRCPCLSSAQMSGEAVTQLFPLISTCQ